MKQTWDYLEHVAFRATVCDKEGVVLYQNRVAMEADGNVVGKNLFKCHSPKSAEHIRRMLETGENNTYEVIKKGKRYFVQHEPWFKEPNGEVAGLIELVIGIPDSHPTYNRDKHEG